MNTRLSRFLAAENITRSQFADSIGVARASISHIISGRNKPSYEFIAAMLKRYPQINPDWLILGTGKMYRDMSKPTEYGTYTQPSPSVEGGDALLFPVELPELQLNAAGGNAGDNAAGYGQAVGSPTAAGTQAADSLTTADSRAGTSDGTPATAPDSTAAGTHATTPSGTPYGASAGTPATTPSGTPYGAAAGMQMHAENPEQARPGQRVGPPVPHSAQTASGLRPRKVSKVIVLFDDNSFQELF